MCPGKCKKTAPSDMLGQWHDMLGHARTSFQMTTNSVCSENTFHITTQARSLKNPVAFVRRTEKRPSMMCVTHHHFFCWRGDKSTVYYDDEHGILLVSRCCAADPLSRLLGSPRIRRVIRFSTHNAANLFAILPDFHSSTRHARFRRFGQ